MNKNTAFTIENEVLQNDDVCKLTGHLQARHQIKWLNQNCWKFHVSAKGSPIIGAWYARMKLAGVEPSNFSVDDLTDLVSLMKKTDCVMQTI